MIPFTIGFKIRENHIVEGKGGVPALEKTERQRAFGVLDIFISQLGK